MSSVSIAGDTSGSILLAAPSVAGANTATLPAATGTVMVSGNMPAFFAYSNSTQNISANTTTKVNLNAEEFDTNNNFDSTTNYRFTPTVAGYYQIDASIYFNYGGSAPAWMDLYIYKNGSALRWARTLLAWGIVTTSTVVYMNGTTDYLELYGYTQTNAGQLIGSQTATYLTGSLVRTA